MTLNFMGYLKLEEDPAFGMLFLQSPLRETLPQRNEILLFGIKMSSLRSVVRASCVGTTKK